MATVPQVATALQSVLTTTADEAARSTRCIQRHRKLTGSTFVQGLVFGWMAHPHATYDHLVQAIARAGSVISPQALEQRFTAAAADCLKAVLTVAASTVIAADEVGPSLLTRFTAVWLLDSSTVRLPDVFAEDWPGSGGGERAGVKLHTMLDLRQGALHGPILGAGRLHDKHSPLQTEPIEAGALRITDLGFYALARLRAIGEGGAYWLCRAQVQTHLITPDGTTRTLVDLLAGCRTDHIDGPVSLGVTERLRARIIAHRLDGQAAARRARDIRRAARKKGQTVSADRLALAHWDICVTNVPETLLSAEESRVLLRARWQIELLFKRWKSEGQIDLSRSRQPQRILCELYAKLIGEIIIQWCTVLSAWHALDRSLVKVGRVIRDCSIALGLAMPQRSALRRALTALIQSCQVGCRVNSRTTKPNHCQLIQTHSEALT